MGLEETFDLLPCLDLVLKCNNSSALRALRKQIDKRIEVIDKGKHKVK